MKPRIRRRFGIWYCRLAGVYMIDHYFVMPPCGHGYTPAEAYADWKAQQ